MEPDCLACRGRHRAHTCTPETRVERRCRQKIHKHKKRVANLPVSLTRSSSLSSTKVDDDGRGSERITDFYGDDENWEEIEPFEAENTSPNERSERSERYPDDDEQLAAPSQEGACLLHMPNYIGDQRQQNQHGFSALYDIAFTKRHCQDGHHQSSHQQPTISSAAAAAAVAAAPQQFTSARTVDSETSQRLMNLLWDDLFEFPIFALTSDDGTSAIGDNQLS